jgi:hypothetical protein
MTLAATNLTTKTNNNIISMSYTHIAAVPCLLSRFFDNFWVR